MPGLKHRSLLGYDAGGTPWNITTDGEVIRRYQPQQMRLLVHWSAELYRDRDELQKSLDHTDDLTFDMVFDRLLNDLRSRGLRVAEPTDPLHDKDFIRTLIETYSSARRPTGRRPKPKRSVTRFADLDRTYKDNFMNEQLFRLDGKVAIVTGSTKGIGKAMARGLAAAGALVVVSSRKQDLCDEVAQELQDETGGQVLGLACHVGDWATIPSFLAEVRERTGGPHVLINNAGINPARITASDMTLEYWRKVFSVNLEGPLRLSQQAAPIMRDLGGGSIVNIATMAGYSGGPNICAYGASKAALINLTKSMAQEWAEWNVRVNVLSPARS